MRAIFTPDQVATWTPQQIADLVGRYVAIEVAADGYAYWNDPAGYSGPWEGGSGVCVEASAEGESHRRGARVVWDWGMEWHWIDGQPVFVSVCDEHEEHGGPDGVDCLDRLAKEVRGD